MNRFIKAFCSTAVCLSVIINSVFAVNAAFSDVSVNDWYFDAVSSLAEKGIVSGIGNNVFAPNNYISRAEYIKLVVSATIGTQPEGENHWAENYVKAAVENNIIDAEAYPMDKLDTPITRQRMAKINVRCMENVLKEEVLDNYNFYSSVVTDFESCCPKCKEYITKAYASGLVNGRTDGSFDGFGKLTRAEACAALERLINKDKRIVISFNQ